MPLSKMQRLKKKDLQFSKRLEIKQDGEIRNNLLRLFFFCLLSWLNILFVVFTLV